MDLTEQVTESLKAYFDYVHGLLSEDPSGLWFRGVPNKTYNLTPSLLRNSQVTNIESLKKMERNLLGRFNERSVPYLSHRVDDVWEQLFLMQHYGVPTRLLDWTENPSIALFFALSSAKKTNGDYQEDCAVWVLDPIRLNDKTFRHLGPQTPKGPRSVKASEMNGYKPESIDNMMPAAIYGIHNSPRIVAQRGSFTIQGNNLTPLDVMFTQDADWDQKTLRKIVIPKDEIDNILSMLVCMGITDATIYPDLNGLALEIKRNFGYEV
ncbi:FRG domain-containing protein [Aeromonas veronii]|uniref:FRG domain-containing protein n=1 Tax=Aeromonas veronii TaxID=654 RepID=UPI002B460011|nr:FRG domain-containing protein [Aeromonas veronii]